MSSDLVTKILIAAPHLINVPDKYGSTVMHYAAMYQPVSTIKLLLKLDSRLITYKDDQGRLPIHCAAKHNNRDVISLLVKAGSPLNEPDKYGATLLHERMSSDTDTHLTIELLVRLGANSFEAKQCGGCTPLMHRSRIFGKGSETRANMLCLLHLGCNPTEYRERCRKLNKVPITWTEDEAAETRYRVYFAWSLLDRLLFFMPESEN
jgi:hypothetical protein